MPDQNSIPIPKNTKVKVYLDPITRQDLEGEPILDEIITPNVLGGCLVHVWVQYNDMRTTRFVHVDDIPEEIRKWISR